MRVIAVDLGSSAARVIAGSFDGQRLELSQVARFEHTPRTTADGRVVWNLDELVDGVVPVVAGLATQGAASVAVDSWGVDHVLTDEAGHAVRPVASYRDPRTRSVPATLERRGIDAGRLWTATGVRPDPINTSHQLVAALATLTPAEVGHIARVQMVPDQVAARLGAAPGWSQGVCSTTGLTAPGAGTWAWDLIEGLGLPARWFGPITSERTVAGYLAGHIAGARKVPILRAGSHDTACAVHALPGDPVDRVFLCSGSWSLLGAEIDRPLLDDRVHAAGFTHESRTDGGTRLLRNIPGLWIIQECVRQWGREGAGTRWQDLVAAARAAGPARALIDPADPAFHEPGDMPARVRAAVHAAGGDPPVSAGEIARVVLESLAASYARTLASLTAVTGIRPTCLTVVGGGARNTLLNELTANACGLPVVAGPAEATSAGSILAQLETLGEICPDDRRHVIAASFPTRVTEPDPALPQTDTLPTLSNGAHSEHQHVA